MAPEIPPESPYEDETIVRSNWYAPPTGSIQDAWSQADTARTKAIKSLERLEAINAGEK